MTTLSTERSSTRTLWGVGLVVTLLVAVVLGAYASSRPDGLEYVAERSGFLEQAEDSATADSPLADYGVRGVDNERVSVGLAGLAGCLVVLGVTGGLVLALRRRDDEPDEA